MAFRYTVKQGDSLNAISQKYGFSNYKMAGISSVPSGNFDLIRPGEEITLGNYDPTAIKPIGSTSPVLSSGDAAGEFKAAGTALDAKLAPPATTPITDIAKTDTGTPAPKTDGAAQNTSGDPLYDEFLKNQQTVQTDSAKWGADKQAEVRALLPKTLSFLDEQYASSVLNITSTYDKLITEQQKINQTNVDRTKAYGLSAGGQYMPLEFTQAVSLQEQKAANEISTLETERNSLLAKAKAARDQGEITTLRENMDAINKVEDQMRQRTKDLADEVQKRYELVVKVRQEQEKKRVETAQKTLDAAKIRYLKEFQDAKTDEEKTKLIRKIILDSGGTLNDKDFYSIYSSLAGASQSAKDATAKAAKDAADLAKSKQDTAKSISEQKINELKTPGEMAKTQAEADAARALAEERRKGSDKIDVKGVQGYLSKQGLPLTIMSTKGELTTSALNKIVSNGVSLETANGIWANMVAGNSFDDIRKGMKSQGMNTKILDKFVEAIQGR